MLERRILFEFNKCYELKRKSSYNYSEHLLNIRRFVFETLTIIFREIQINENFDLADQFYEIHILSNYTLIGLIVLHITAVIIHKLFFGDNLLKRIL